MRPATERSKRARRRAERGATRHHSTRVSIATAWEVLFSRLYAAGALPIATLDLLREEPSQEPRGLLVALVGVLIVMSIADAHFYWTHRMLHASPWLYRNGAPQFSLTSFARGP